MQFHTLIRSSLCALAALGTTAWAEHGSTKAFEERFKKLRKEVEGKVRNQRLDPHWTEDAVFYKREGEDGWIRVDPATGERSEVEKKPDDTKRSREPKSFERKVKRKSSPRGHLSPDKKWKVEVSEGEVKLRDEEEKSSEVVGKSAKGWRFSRNVMWSPDSKHFAVWKREKAEVRTITYVESSPKDQLQPKTFTRNYAKPGDKLSVERPMIFTVGEEKPIEVSSELAGEAFDFRRHGWREKGARFAFEFIERGFGKHRLLEIDAAKRTQRIVVKEDSETFVFVFGKSYRRDLKDGEEILWFSERDGWNHLYVMDGANGEVKRQLTKGEWIVREVVAFDEEKGELLLKVNGYYQDQDPYFQHWARVELASGKLTMLTESNGTHDLRFSPDGKFYLAHWSRVDHPPVHELRRTEDGGLVAVLEKADASELLKTTWKVPQPFVAKDRNGKFDIWGVIWRPRDFDPKKKYPVIEQIYAGPQGSYVPKSWSVWAGNRSQMAESGFIVVQIDGLGTSNRCKEFHHFCYKNLKDAGLPDRIVWMKAAAKEVPQMDLERVGIFGGSAGGQSALGAVLFHAEFYDAAAADCGCHDNRMDKIWWNEQWMDWPIGDHYEENSNATHADKLEGELLLTVGEVDDNVDPSSTLQVANALIKVDKDFELVVVPGAGHGVGERPYLKRKRVEFFQRALGGPVERGDGKTTSLERSPR